MLTMYSSCFFSSRRRHTRFDCDWSSDVCSSDLYRDYVIKAFNENKRFDVFTREQLAGDLLPHGGQEQKVGSAFNRLLLTTEEGGAQPKDYEVRMLTDRVRVIGTVWLGQNIGCAQCHDHKFDPITPRDIYSMGAFFSG